VTGQPSAPSMIVEWLPGVSPATPNLAAAWVGSWSTLSNVEGKCRLLGYSSRRGRDDVLDGYPAGTLTLTLNNSDGALDEDVSTSEVYGNGAGTPIRVRMTDPRFAGFLQSGWKNVSPQRSRDRIVQIDVWDWLGWAASKQGPGSPIVYEALYNIKAAVNAGQGAFWLRGPLSAFPAGVTPAGSGAISRMWDYAGSSNGARSATAADAPSGSGAVSVENPPIAPTTPLPCCVHFSGAYMSVLGNGVATSATDAVFHAMMIFQTAGPASAGRHLLRGHTLTTNQTWWSFGISSSGTMFAEVNNAAGSNIGLLAVNEQFDDEQPHWVIFQLSNTTNGAFSLITDLGNASGNVTGTPAGAGGELISTGAVAAAEDPIAIAEVQYAGRGRLRFVTSPFEADGQHPADRAARGRPVDRVVVVDAREQLRGDRASPRPIGRWCRVLPRRREALHARQPRLRARRR